MITVIAIMILLIYGMPFIGAKLMTDKENRTLGLAVLVVGLIVWAILGVS